MINISKNSIGEAWKELVLITKENGEELSNEGLELIDVRVSFKHCGNKEDDILKKFADFNMINNMMKVFFSTEENILGHSYLDQINSPFHGNYITDIVRVLGEKRDSKRATLTLGSRGGGKVPCINVINFLVRDNKLNVYYFSRGQDVYKKFYADALCIAKMQSEIAENLSILEGDITGYIVSSHIYYEDNHKIEDFLFKAR